MTQPQRSRQLRALDRLMDQLEKGTKVTKEDKIVPLTTKDTKRIESEIETLKKKS